MLSVKTAFHRDECLADLLRDSMKGAGTNDDALIRLVLAFSEVSKMVSRTPRAHLCQLTRQGPLLSTVLPLLLRHSAKSFTLIGDKAPPAANDSSELARPFNQRCYPHTGKGGHS